MADNTDSFIDSIFGGLSDVVAGAGELFGTTNQYFGKSEAELKKEAEEREIKRLQYQAQILQTQQNAQKTQSVSDNQKILIFGAVALGVLFLTRGK